jgi:uncharacterized membrane protein
MIRNAALSAFLIFSVVSCGAYHESFDTPVPDKSNYKLSELGFATVQRRVFALNCASCHGNSGGVNLQTYESVKANLAGITRTVFVTKTMPKSPGQSLNSDQLGLLNAWIQAGAPETAPNEELGTTPVTAEFESIRTNILVPKCQICHAPGKPVARIPLITKEDLLNSPLELVIPGNIEESGLVIAITRQDQKRMPPVKDEHGNPTGFSSLPDVDIQAIKNWILEGAQK